MISLKLVLILLIVQVMTFLGGIGKPAEVVLDPVAEADIYQTADSVIMPMDSLRATETVTPEDISHTMAYIEKTKKGEIKKREPLSVVERGDGTYSILDGNRTFSALKELGAKSFPVIVQDRPYHKDVETFEDLVRIYSEAESFTVQSPRSARNCRRKSQNIRI